ncbi:hypothetical protein LJC52_03925 [Bacteroidales bacterium OttesenSCG-928-A17]|nr:hypothetical protein [Bacteroidales bacterium OttesenSCG-928-A17]
MCCFRVLLTYIKGRHVIQENGKNRIGNNALILIDENNCIDFRVWICFDLPCIVKIDMLVLRKDWD